MITTPIYRCALCGWQGRQIGSRLRRVRGVRTRICGPCFERETSAREDSQPARPTAGGRETRGGRADAPRLDALIHE